MEPRELLKKLKKSLKKFADSKNVTTFASAIEKQPKCSDLQNNLERGWKWLKQGFFNKIVKKFFKNLEVKKTCLTFAPLSRW